MLVSICTLGNSELLPLFIEKYKDLSYYKKRDSDTEGVRIHVSYVDDENLLESALAHRSQLVDGNYKNVINDGTQGTKKESTISNDIDWLLSSDGHDTIVELSNNDEKYLDTIISLLGRGYETYITSRIYLDKYWKTLESAAASANTRVVYSDNIYDIIGNLDDKYYQRLAHQRKSTLEDSYTVPPCGFN